MSDHPMNNPPDDKRCVGTSTRSGERCRRWAMRGGRVCHKHGGKAPQVMAAAKRRTTMEKAKVNALAYASKMIAQDGDENPDPASKLIKTLSAWNALAEFWGELCAGLDVAAVKEIGDGLRGELKYSAPTDELDLLAVGTSDHLLGFNRHGEAAIHPFVTEYKDALRELAKVAKMCLDAGIAERKVKLAEAQGRLLANAIRGIVGEIEKMLGQPISSRPDFPVMVRRQLALVSGG